MRPVPKKIDPPTYQTPPRSPMSKMAGGIALLIIAVLLVNIFSGYGLDLIWRIAAAVVLVLITVGIWRFVRRRKRAVDHEKWVSGLGSGFSQQLKQARLEATRWKRKK